MTTQWVINGPTLVTNAYLTLNKEHLEKVVPLQQKLYFLAHPSWNAE